MKGRLVKEVNTLDLKSNAERLESSSLSSSTKEEWKPVVGYEFLFEVSNLGNFRRKASEKNLAQTTHKHGYKLVATYPEGRKGKAKCFRVHREVAKAFIDNPKNKPQINHKDGNKTNNKVENLEWCTPKENTVHAYSTGLAKGKQGEQNPCCKVSDDVVLEIMTIVEQTNESLRAVCKKYEITHATVSRRFKKLKGK